VCLFGACSKPSSTTPTTPPTRLTLGVTAEPSSLVPFFGGSAADSEVSGFLFRELVVHTSEGVRGDLAARVPVIGDGAVVDGQGRLVVSWALVPGARWTDGTAVTSRDVVAGWKVATDEAQPITAGRDQQKRIERIDVVGDTHFVVTWKDAAPGFAAPRVHRVLPAHLVLDEQGAPKNLAASGFLRRPIGNGAYVLAEEVPGAHLRLVRRKDTGGEPSSHRPPDEVLVRVVPSTEALTSALIAGDVDATLPHVGLSPIDAARLVADHPDRFTVARAPGTTWAHLDFNLDDVALKDARVRRAFAHAVDRVAIVSAIAGDAYDVDEGFLPRHHPARMALPRVVVDHARAEALLDEAGYKRPSPGAMRTDAGGKPWRVQLASASGQRDTERLLQLVQADLAKVGVDVALDLRPFKVFFAEGAKKRKLPHLAFYAWTVDADSTGGSLWRADRIPSEANGWSGLNLPGWRDDDVTRALTEADATLDDAVRARALALAQERFHEGLPALSFYFRPTVVVARVGVTGISPTGTPTPAAALSSTWQVDPPAHRPANAGVVDGGPRP